MKIFNKNSDCGCNKPNSKLKKRMIVTFVLGTILANIIIAMVGVGMSHYAITKMRMKYGSDFVPSVQITVLRMLVCVIFILIMLGIMLYSRVYSDIMSPLRVLSEATKRIAEGDLDFTIEPAGHDDEIDELCMDFEDMRRRLKESAEGKIEDEEHSRQLISNITHDLKTPITTIKGYAEGLLDGVAVTPEKQEKYLRTIYNKAGELDKLLNELTYYTHIDQSRIPYNFAKIDLGEYFRDCVDEIGNELESRNFSLTYRSNVPAGTQIIADSEQLRKVINNIVGNSIKYCDKNQGRIRINLRDAEQFVLIEISDNGQGIQAKELPMIFDRFFRSDASRSSATGGSGIGLSIVKKIVEDHGGRIWATSTVGEGTTMHIELRKYEE